MVSGYVILDKYFNIVSGSPDFFKFVGVLNFESLLKIVHPSYKDKLVKASENLENVEEEDIFLEIRNTEGEYREVYAVLKRTSYMNEGVHCFGMEITDVKNSLRKMKETDEENFVMKSIMEKRNAMIFVYEAAAGRFEIYSVGKNRNYDVFCGTVDEWFDRCVQGGTIDKKNTELFNLMCSDIKACNSFEYEICFNPGTDESSAGLYRFTGSCDYSGDGGPRLIGALTSSSSKAMEAISHYRRDPMTGLLDKPSIVQYAKDRIGLAAATGERIVIAMIDMDDFKAVNDRLGHVVGDRVITRFAEILSKSVGPYGAAGRYGGDEFMAVFTNFKDLLELRSFLRSIRTTVQLEFKNIDGSDCSVTCSIGCTEFPTDGKNFEQVFSKADICVYIAKEYGKNRYIIYDDRVKAAINTDEDLWEGRSNRVAKNNDLTFNLTSMLFSKGEKAVPLVLEKLGSSFNLAHIRIFSGDGMKPVFTWARENEEIYDQADGQYIFEEGYAERFDINNVLRIDNISKLEMRFPKAFEMLKKSSVNSAVQYIIKKDDEIQGLISFELSPPARRYWHESEVSTFALISQLISQIIIKINS